MSKCKPKKSSSALVVVCKKCGGRRILEIGTTSQSMAMIKCPNCGYRQAPAERCAKCGTSLVGMEKEAEDFRPHEENKPGLVLRHYKTLVIIAALMILVIFLGSIAGVFLLMKVSDAYKISEAFIRNNKEIRGVVGNDIKFGLIPMGSVKISGREGAARFRIHVKGSKGSTDVRIFLRKTRGKWQIVSAIYTDRHGIKRRLLPKNSYGPGTRKKVPFGKSKL